MQLATILTLFTTASVAYAWRFTAYSLKEYKGDKILDRSGNALTNNLCIDIIENDNRMSSFKWNQGGNPLCQFKLFDRHGCRGSPFAISTTSWEVDAISPRNDNKASSVWFDCLRW